MKEKTTKPKKEIEKRSQSAGFEPARAEPNGFLVHRLNHSATTAMTSYVLKIGFISRNACFKLFRDNFWCDN